MRKSLAMFTVAALALGGDALAGDMSYSYVQTDLLGAELSGGGYGTISGSGFGVKGALEAGPYLFGFAEYRNARYAGSGVKARFIPGSLGAGAHVSFSSSLDFFGGVSLERMEVRTGFVGSKGFDVKESFKGWGVGIGMRGWIGENFQWTGMVKHRDLRDLQSITSIMMGFHYFFRPAYALGMDYTYQKFDNHMLYGRDSVGTVNLRYSFGGN